MTSFNLEPKMSKETDGSVTYRHDPNSSEVRNMTVCIYLYVQCPYTCVFILECVQPYTLSAHCQGVLTVDRKRFVLRNGTHFTDKYKEV